MSDNLKEKLEKLEAALEKDSSTLTEVAAIATASQMETAKAYLTDAALEGLSKKVKTLTHTDDDGTYKCIYLARTCRADKVSLAVEAICEDLNLLAEKGWLKYTVSDVCSIDLARIPFRSPLLALFSFVLVPIDKEDEAKKLLLSTTEAGLVGKDVGPTEPDLLEDEFLAQINVGHAAILIKDFNEEQLLIQGIDQYLAVLPRGTEVVEAIRCAVWDLSIPYEVRFKNPLMKAYKTVELQYRRHAERVGDKIEQFKLLTGVKYTRKDGKPTN